MKKLNILALCAAVCLSSCDPLGIEPTKTFYYAVGRTQQYLSMVNSDKKEC